MPAEMTMYYPTGGGLSAWSKADPDWKNIWAYPSDAAPPQGIHLFEDVPGHYLFEPAFTKPYLESKTLLNQTSSE